MPRKRPKSFFKIVALPSLRPRGTAANSSCAANRLRRTDKFHKFRAATPTAIRAYFAIAGITGFQFGAGVSYNSLTFGSTADNVWIPSSAVVDTMLRYATTHWDAQVGIKNLTNIEYFTTAESAGGYVGQPRTYYAKADWHY